LRDDARLISTGGRWFSHGRVIRLALPIARTARLVKLAGIRARSCDVVLNSTAEPRECALLSHIERARFLWGDFGVAFPNKMRHIAIAEMRGAVALGLNVVASDLLFCNATALSVRKI